MSRFVFLIDRLVDTFGSDSNPTNNKSNRCSYCPYWKHISKENPSKFLGWLFVSVFFIIITLSVVFIISLLIELFKVPSESRYDLTAIFVGKHWNRITTLCFFLLFWELALGVWGVTKLLSHGCSHIAIPIVNCIIISVICSLQTYILVRDLLEECECLSIFWITFVVVCALPIPILSFWFDSLPQAMEFDYAVFSFAVCILLFVCILTCMGSFFSNTCEKAFKKLQKNKVALVLCTNMFVTIWFIIPKLLPHWMMNDKRQEQVSCLDDLILASWGLMTWSTWRLAIKYDSPKQELILDQSAQRKHEQFDFIIQKIFGISIDERDRKALVDAIYDTYGEIITNEQLIDEDLGYFSEIREGKLFELITKAQLPMKYATLWNEYFQKKKQISNQQVVANGNANCMNPHTIYQIRNKFVKKNTLLTIDADDSEYSSDDRMARIAEGSRSGSRNGKKVYEEDVPIYKGKRVIGYRRISQSAFPSSTMTTQTSLDATPSVGEPKKMMKLEVKRQDKFSHPEPFPDDDSGPGSDHEDILDQYMLSTEQEKRQSIDDLD